MNRSWMIVLISAAFLACPTFGRAQEIHWQSDLNAAKSMAKSKQLPLLLDFGTNNCYWCRQLDATTFRDPSIAKLLSEKFIAVKIDASRDPGLAQSMGVSAYPTLILVTPDGKMLDRHEGYVQAPQLRAQLMKALAQCNTAPAPAPVAMVNPVAIETPRFVLRSPEQLGIGTKLYPPTARPQDVPVDPGSLFTRLREVGAIGFHLKRTDSGYLAQIELPGAQSQNVSVEGQGPSESAAIAAAIARIAR